MPGWPAPGGAVPAAAAQGEGPREPQRGPPESATREAIRAAIRGQAGPGTGIPGAAAGSRHDRLTLPPAAGRAVPSRAERNSFPDENELLRRPPVWQRTMRRLPVAVPGEGPLRKAPSARDRERKRALMRFGALVGVIVLIGGGLWLASARDKSGGSGGPGANQPAPVLVRVPAAGAVASSQSGSRLAGNVIDGKLGTFWSRLVPSQDDQPFVRFSFDQPVKLGRLTIAAGASGAEFSKRPRPEEIQLEFSDGTTLRTTLADKPGFQTVSFEPREVDRVRLVILSTYPSSGPQRTSISEVRFYSVKG